MRYPGTMVVEFLDPLPSGLPRDEFLARIETVIEDATNRLVEAGRLEQAQLFGRVPGAIRNGRSVNITIKTGENPAVWSWPHVCYPGTSVRVKPRRYNGHMRIGELARRTGVSERSLRYYEQQGLLASTAPQAGSASTPNGPSIG